LAGPDVLNMITRGFLAQGSSGAQGLAVAAPGAQVGEGHMIRIAITAVSRQLTAWRTSSPPARATIARSPPSWVAAATASARES